MEQTDLPSIQEAEKLLTWAHNNNPGPWLNHSRVVARAAKTIAKKADMDVNTAYILGLLHDIGRYEGVTGLRHVFQGYRLMQEKGYHLNAKICLTHSFPCKDIDSFVGKNDCTPDETLAIREALEKFVYDDYDRLIQLCDAICMAEGVCILEVRLVDVVRRHNTFNPKILEKWNAFFGLKEHFDKKCKTSIYNLFKKEITGNLLNG